MTKEPVRGSDEALLDAAKTILVEGRAEAKAAVEPVKVRTYWRLGRLVNRYLRTHRGRAGYGGGVVRWLAPNLGMSWRNLYEILNFQRRFPIVRVPAQLPWTHYNLLSQVLEKRERERLFRQAVRGHWNTRELTERIRRKKLPLSGGDVLSPAPTSAERARPLPALVPIRGAFYTYRLVKPRDLHPTEEFYSVDLGFTTRIDLNLSGISRPREGMLVEVVRTKKSSLGDRYRFKKSSKGPASLYTYKATVETVWDADTLWLQIDLGFRVWTRQKIRLRGINAAEAEEGRKATRYVKRVLSQVAFVVIGVTRRDKFDRYLTDVFYLKGETDPQKVLEKGNYLNQELLDRGLAKRYEE